MHVFRYMARLDAEGKAYICERRRVTGTFLESMELNDFPFDTQVRIVYKYEYVKAVAKPQSAHMLYMYVLT